MREYRAKMSPDKKKEYRKKQNESWKKWKLRNSAKYALYRKELHLRNKRLDKVKK